MKINLLGLKQNVMVIKLVHTAQKMKSVKDFFSKCNQIHSHRLQQEAKL